MWIALSLLICIIGLLMFALSTNPKVAEIGKIMFTVGLLVFLLCTCSGMRIVGIVGSRP